MKKKYLSLKPAIKMLTFQLNFVSGAYLIDLTKPREVSLKENVHHFSVDYNSIDKLDILNTHKYLIVKNKIK